MQSQVNRRPFTTSSVAPTHRGARPRRASRGSRRSRVTARAAPSVRRASRGAAPWRRRRGRARRGARPTVRSDGRITAIVAGGRPRIRLGSVDSRPVDDRGRRVSPSTHAPARDPRPRRQLRRGVPRHRGGRRRHLPRPARVLGAQGGGQLRPRAARAASGASRPSGAAGSTSRSTRWSATTRSGASPRRWRRSRRCAVDGVIVQDLGAAAIARRYFPALELHASTQMAVHNADGLAELGRLGLPARHPRARADPGGDRRPAPGLSRHRARGVRARRALLQLLGRLPRLVGAHRAVGQPGRLRADLPRTVHAGRWRSGRASVRGRRPAPSSPAATSSSAGTRSSWPASACARSRSRGG